MQIALLQTNPKLGAFKQNAERVCSSLQAMALGSEGNLQLDKAAVCLTSSFALCGNPWKSISYVGGFCERMGQASAMLSKCACRVLASSFSDAPRSPECASLEPVYFLSGAPQKTIFKEDCLEIDSLVFFAPHDLASTSFDALIVPSGVHIIYLACAHRFYEGFDVETALVNLAKRVHLPVVYVNTCGATDGIVYAGRSMLVSKEGAVLASLHAFTEDALIFEFNGTEIECGPTPACHLSLLESSPESPSESFGLSVPLVTPRLEKDAALFMGASLAIKDYAQKCGIKQALIGMSGGMDSALVAALACEALGAENVLGIMMPSKYSSEHSVDDAVLLMKNLGMAWHSITISSITEAFETALEPSFSTLVPFANKEDDLTPDNIQARTRGNLLMAFANRSSRMVIGTGNKSEAAMGYCTLYGDTVGALEPISDIYKTRVYDVAAWYNEWKKTEIIPMNIFTKAPSAELRPDQKDEDTLPAYPLLDRILEQILEKGMDPNSIEDPELTQENKQIILSRLVASEFKRKQSPFVVALSSCAFGHVWNAPITSKAF